MAKCKYFYYYFDSFGNKKDGCKISEDGKCFYILPTLMGCPWYELEED